MKRDWDLIRELLTTIEGMSAAERNDAQYVLQYGADDPETETAIMLYRAGFLIGVFNGGLNDTMLISPELTWEGHELLDTIRSKGVCVLERKGMVEVISSLETDGRKIPYDIRMGVWVTVEAETGCIKHCFEECNAHTDPSGRYFTLYKRWHLIGLEVGVSVASVALRGEPTGVASGWNADVAATAKRDLQVGEVLDGEGGYTLWGKPLPAATSVAIGGLPLGLAHNVKLP